MAEELLSLKWNNHQAHFVDILTFLREQEIFIDATLACGGKLYPAHKFVLSTCSDYFKQMFTKNPNKHPIVFMKDVTCRDLEALLDFMYNGEVNVPQSSLGSLIKTAEGLQIKGLAVPDDPPFSKRDHSVIKDRRDRDQKSRRDKSFSPPPKRLRERDRSPLLNSSASPFPNHSQSRIRSPHNSSNNQLSVNTGLSKLEETLDEDSRTSVHSGISEHSHSVSNKKTNVNSQSQLGNEDNTGESENSNQPTTNEPSPGPSGLHRTTQSKEEELDIKQEEDMGLVDLGGEDDDDWRDGEGMEGNSLDDGGTSVSSANAQGFSDVLLPLSDGSLPSGDPAMKKSDWSSFLHHHIDTGESTEGSTRMKVTAQLGSSFVSPSFGLDSTSIQRLLLESTTSSSLSKSVEDVRPFPCKFCEARFKKKQHLQNHERIHTGEKYMCLLCGLAFSRLHILKHHVGRKHNVTQSDVI